MDPIKLTKGDVIEVAETLYVFVREAKGTLYILPYAHRDDSDPRLVTTCPRHVFDMLARDRPFGWGVRGSVTKRPKLA